MNPGLAVPPNLPVISFEVVYSHILPTTPSGMPDTKRVRTARLVPDLLPPAVAQRRHRPNLAHPRIAPTELRHAPNCGPRYA